MSDYKDYGFHNDAPTHNMSYSLDEVVSLLDGTKNQYILDLGCGNGYLVNQLLSKGYNAYGTDASEKGIEIAKKKHSNRFFVQDLSVDTLPVQLQKIPFDTIIATEVIEHLYNPGAFIDFCKNQLKQGGELIITTPYHGYLKNLMLSIFDKWDSHMDPLWLGGHIKLWSRKTLTKALNNADFEVITFKGCGRVPYFWKSMVIKAKLP